MRCWKGAFPLKYLVPLLLLAPLAVIAEIADFGSTPVFLLSAGAMLPLSGFIGKATEDLALRSGERIGGLLNVTFGNAAEIIIATVALREGLTDLVKASIAGSILGNALLVLGLSLLVGGLKNGRQTFDSHVAGISATMLLLAVVALSMEALFSTGPHAVEGDADKDALSVGIAVLLLIMYGLYLVYTLFLHEAQPGKPPGVVEEVHEAWPLRTAIGVLVGATVGAVVMSELLVGAAEPVIESWGVSEIFLGVMIIPVVGNAAEHWAGVVAAYRNQMELSIGIAVGSSLQIALFAAPVLVFVGFILGEHLQLIFNQYELFALVGATAVAAFVSFDGESNWVEGAMLLTLYLIFGFGFFFLT